MKKKYKVGICGSFGGAEKTYDGQTVKTKNVLKAFENALGKSNVTSINTHYWRKENIKLFARCVKMAFECEHIIILPARNGIRIFLPLFVMIKKLAGAKLHYSVVGGWLGSFLENKKLLRLMCKRVDKIFVETGTMFRQLSDMGFSNLAVAANCKEIAILKEDELLYHTDAPLKLCTFSRVMEQKGIGETVDVIKRINEQAGQTVFELDIYGMVDNSYKDEFEEMKKNFPPYIRYLGMADSSKTTEVLKNYFLLLFPTKFATEGFPGTILDGFCAGVPVLSARWNSCFDIVEEEVNGVTFGFCDFNDMYNKLVYIEKNPDYIKSMKKNCLESAKRYTPEAVTSEMLKEMQGFEQEG